MLAPGALNFNAWTEKRRWYGDIGEWLVTFECFNREGGLVAVWRVKLGWRQWLNLSRAVTARRWSSCYCFQRYLLHIEHCAKVHIAYYDTHIAQCILQYVHFYKVAYLAILHFAHLANLVRFCTFCRFSFIKVLATRCLCHISSCLHSPPLISMTLQ